MFKHYNVDYKWQGFTLHCWRTAVEMLMRWKHGPTYGIGISRPKVEDEKWYGSATLENASKAYGFNHIDALCQGSDDIIKTFKTCLEKEGPLLTGGNYGPAAIFPGKHTILIIGYGFKGQDNNEGDLDHLLYHDPFTGKNKIDTVVNIANNSNAHLYYGAGTANAKGGGMKNSTRAQLK